MGIPLPSIRVLAIWVLITLVVLGVGIFLFAWSGLYSVAASRGHWAVVSWFLEFTMRSSVRTHSLLIEPPSLDDPDLVKLGAGHYAGGCAPCHGGPGGPRNPIMRHMLPEPTVLTKAIPTWETAELFSIVKHGLKYTGMPGWVAPQRDDEVWAVVAFLRRLPAMTPEEYRALARGNVDQVELSAGEILRAGTVESDLAACARCHGGAEARPTSRLVPKLAGQKQPYLAQELRNYAAGLRSSGVMQPVAAALDEGEIERLAAYYAGLQVQPELRAEAGGHRGGKGDIELGRKIATEGISPEWIPPCLVCHNPASSALFPNLAGQHAAYIAGQLRVWKNGLRARTAGGQIMAAIATRLSEEQIAAVAAYFESLAPADAAPDGSASEGRQ